MSDNTPATLQARWRGHNSLTLNDGDFDDARALCDETAPRRPVGELAQFVASRPLPR